MSTGNFTLHKDEVVYAESLNLDGTAVIATAANMLTMMRILAFIVTS